MRPATPQLVRDRVPGRVDVAEDECGAGGGQAAGDVGADPAEADDREPAAGEVGRAEHGGAQGVQGRDEPAAVCGRGVAAAAGRGGAAGDVAGALADDEHVVRAGADVGAGAVPAAEGLDGVAHVEQHGPPVERPGGQRHDGLAAAVARPATAHLPVIAADSRSASRSPSVPVWIAASRQPPSAWPRAVECSAMMTGSPLREPERMTTCSCSNMLRDGSTTAEREAAGPNDIRNMRQNGDVDELDSAIVELLQQDARQTNRELAAAVGIAPSTCLERVRSLRERGVITGFHAEVSLPALNRHVQAFLHVQIRPLSRQVIEGFKAHVTTLPEVLSVFVVAGGDDFLGRCSWRCGTSTPCTRC